MISKRYPKDIINKLSEEFALTPEEIEKIVDSQFQFVRRMMVKGNTKGVKLMKLGHFLMKPWMRGRVEERKRVLKEQASVNQS